MNTLRFITLLLLMFAFSSCSHKKTPDNAYSPINEWLKKNYIPTINDTITILGNPDIIKCELGNSLAFNGIKDGILINSMSIKNLNEFTIEVIFYPEKGGDFEQRFLHFGEILGNRVLLETRTTKNSWYLDAYIKSDMQKCALIDSTLLHPLNKWYHIAYTVDHGNLTTYVDGKEERRGQIEFTPLTSGQTSVGMRQDKRSWFKGSIHKIRITPRILSPHEFLRNTD
jgi:hypothetical protein